MGPPLVRIMAELARHYSEAAVSGGSDRHAAIDWATRAADAAMEYRAFEDASSQYTLAIDCGGRGLDEPTLAHLSLRRAAADLASGRLAAARAACQQVAERLVRDDGPLWAELALTLEAVGERGWDRDVREWCEQALLLADPG